MNFQLILGYVLVGIAILAATIILVELSYGFGVKDGKVIQNGFVFVSSQPNPANIYIDGKLSKTTNTRLQLADGTYTAKVQRNGYRSWQRTISVQGGSVQRYDYPLLFPTDLKTTVVNTATGASPFVTQSPDRHWLLVSDVNPLAGFSQYDLTNKNPKQTVTNVAIPVSILTNPAVADTFKLAEWSTDNRHVLLLHSYDGGQEYILFDRQTPENSINLTTTLKLTATDTVTLRNKEYNRFFVLDTASGSLSTTNLNDPTLVSYLEHILAYKSYGSDTVLYASNEGAVTGKAVIGLRQNGANVSIRQVSAAPPYLLNLTKYSGDLYVAAGASGESKIYIYKNPAARKISAPDKVVVSNALLRINNPDYLSFSDNARFIMAEKGNQFAIYDAETAKQYNYTTTQPMDAPQSHADWMDGDRLQYVSSGKVTVFDYDYINVQTLAAAQPSYDIFYDRNYKFLYTIAASRTADSQDLTSTSMLIPADQ